MSSPSSLSPIGGGYLVARYGLGVLVSIGNMLVLTWLIGPHAYGIFVTAIGLVAFLAGLARLGVDTYLVRCPSLTPELSATATTLVFTTSVALTLCGSAVAPMLIRWFGNQEFLAPYLVLLLTIPVSGLVGIPTAKLERELNFRAAATIELAGQFVGLVVSLVFALCRAGVWAPVAGLASWQVINLIAAYWVTRQFPWMRWNREQARSMFRYGAGLTASMRIWQLRTLVNPLLVGRFAGAESVAFVALAVRIAESMGTIRLAAGRIAIAALARVQEKREEFRITLQRAIYLQVITLGPLLCGFALFAPWIFRHIVGVRWTPSLTIYPFIAAAVLINSVYNLQASALFVIDRQAAVMRSYAAHVGLLSAGTVLLLPRLGMMGYGWAELLACAAYLLIHADLAKAAPISYRKLTPLLATFMPLIFVPSLAGLVIPARSAVAHADDAARNIGIPIPSTLFGLHFRRDKIGWPSLPFGALRLWDTDTRWQNMNPARGTYDFSVLDDYLSAARKHGVNDILLTLSATPAWASAQPLYEKCDYSATAPGDCAPPADLNPDGTGVNQYWRDFVYHLGVHLAHLDRSIYAPVGYFSIWNEFTRGSSSAHAASARGSSTRASWLGTHQQLLRMVQDANCILTGRGTITAIHQRCTAAEMNLPGTGVISEARIATPDAVPRSPDLAVYASYVALSTAGDSDILAVHAYAYEGSGRTSPDTGPASLSRQWSDLTDSIPEAKNFSLWSTEGSWGDTQRNLPDTDMQMGYLACYYLVGWSVGFERLYWYAADNSWGRLICPNGIGGCRDRGAKQGCPTPAASAWTEVYRWMVGNTMIRACAPDHAGAVWTCELAKPDGTRLLPVWDSSQQCSDGACTSSNYPYPRGFRLYYTLDDEKPRDLAGGTVPIGWKPILLSQ